MMTVLSRVAKFLFFLTTIQLLGSKLPGKKIYFPDVYAKTDND